MARELVPDDPVYFPYQAKRISDCPHCTVVIRPGDWIVRRSFSSPACHYECALNEDALDRAEREGRLPSRKRGERTVVSP